MTHTKAGRTKKAHDTERRQRERELVEALERADEAEPPLEDPLEFDPSREDGAATDG
ncbi:hypothetical protein [Natrinema salaciae]|uniref:Uncharacterized protein n=1 Tax=Natrinema salaciae TaxID=1186196 RepID=A0A1H9IVL1_9EURY|nr:hypothetical protein [Natrinema salaciae]SEQ78633.1 hypothetical protein SAMN04489841_2348 [Natrinema salaciae]